MNTRPRHANSRLLAVLCALLLLVRVDGAHLHLCLDGAEPPLSLHAVDMQLHHEGEVASVPHFDVDLPFPGDASPRSLDTGDAPVLASAAVLQHPVPRGPSLIGARALDAPAYAPPRHLTPPVCGPPRLPLV